MTGARGCVYTGGGCWSEPAFEFTYLAIVLMAVLALGYERWRQRQLRRPPRPGSPPTPVMPGERLIVASLVVVAVLAAIVVAITTHDAMYAMDAALAATLIGSIPAFVRDYLWIRRR